MNVAGWSDETLRRFGDYDAVVAGDRVWTKAIVHEQACRLASAFVGLGIRRGDRVVLLLPNGVEMVIAFEASLRSGAVAVPIFAGASAAEIERIAVLSTPAAIVASADLVRAAHGAAKTIPVRIVTGGGDEAREWAAFDALVAQYQPMTSSVGRDAGDPAVISYTSGTSGAPKGVVHTHGSITARHGGATRRLAARILIALPLGTLGAGMLTGRLAHQWTLILQEKFEPRAFLSAVERYRVTKLVMVPSMGEAIAALPDAGTYDLTSLRSVGFTGADVPATLLARLAAVLPVNPSIAYGMTETGGGIAASGLASKPGSVGRILKGVDVRIVGEDGGELSGSEIGEIYVRTPWMGAGYYRQPDETAAAFSDGWLRTGDLGFVDEDRELFLVGRRKDLIIQGGVKIAPRDVVEVIRGLPDVDECAVVGVPHALLGEQVVACVVRRAGSTLTDDGILDHCRTHLDPRKVPVRVWLRDELPRTPNQKIDVQALRGQLLSGQAAVIETDLIRRLRSAAAAERVPLLRTAVHEQLFRILPPAHPRGASASPDDAAATFGELGLDSLRVAQLGHTLGEALGRAVAPTLFFTHPTVDALCRHLLSEIVGASPDVARTTRRVSAREPVAIVGLGCRLPGGADTPEKYWSLLRRGVDATAEISRWNVDALYDPTRGTPGRIYTRRAALLDAPDMFDAEFFGVSPREAVRLDARHRLVLEVSWEALEHAGYDPRGVSGGLAGLFLGISGASAAGGSGLGAAPSMAVARVCHFLDMRGPAVAVDTSCASSLSAIHSAVQSLRLGECDIAVAGGVQLIGSLRSFVGLSEMSLMAADGRCKAFDASADGFGRGEGCVMIVLRRLTDAQADRNHIVAVVRGSATRHDGRSSSLTAPNGRAQQDVIRAALDDGDVSPRDVDYLEAHGTGTALGDPIELEAAMSVLADRSRRLVVGSVKTNLGHLESAAGAAGLMKVALALEQGEIPAHLNCHTLNPLLDALSSTFVIPSTTQPWPREAGRRRIAGVTSMGLSGTNVHLVVEEAPPAAPRTEDDPSSAGVPANDPVSHLLCLSARTDEALREQVRRYADHLARVTPAAFGDHCFTANAGRAHFACRLAVIARTPSAAREQLIVHTTGMTSASREGVGGTRAKVAFLFTDDGSPFRGLGRQLYETEPAFRRALHRCAEILHPVLTRPLIAALYSDPPAPEVLRLEQAQLAHPALFAFEWSLCELWKSWGIEPDLVLGHGIGERVAACVAGVVTLEEGLRRAAGGATAGDALGIGSALPCVSLVSTQTDRRAAPEGYDVIVDMGQPAGREQMLESLAALYVRGVDPDWRGFYAESAFRRVALPTYPFERKSYGHGAAISEAREAGPVAVRGPARHRAARASVQDETAAQRLEQLIDVVRQQVSEVVERPPESLSVNQNCLELGMDSLAVLDVVTAVRRRTGIACTPADFISGATIAGFAAHLCAHTASTTSETDRPGPRSPLVVLNDRGARAPLFCMHPSGGQVTAYLRLRSLLGDEQPLYALQSRALQDAEHEHATIESMAAEYATVIQAVRRDGPYRLLGWSMGGLIALAVAAELERRGAPVEMIGMIDAIRPHSRPTPAGELAFALTAIGAEVQPGVHVRGVDASDLDAATAMAPADLLAWCEAHGRIPPETLSHQAFDAMLRLYLRHFQLVRDYRPATVDAPIVEWRASSLRRPSGWAAHSRAGATETFVGGSHFSVMQPPQIEQIAADLESGSGTERVDRRRDVMTLYEVPGIDVLHTEPQR